MAVLTGIGVGLLSLLGGYVVGAILGALAVIAFSANRHDRQQEMGMTAVFVTGPLGGVLGLIVGVIVYCVS